ncbi:MAG: Phosphatidylserine decarboxylase proenzyme [Pseudomonadota bacterium]|jgi:phosphatidylserine decarboxylase
MSSSRQRYLALKLFLQVLPRNLVSWVTGWLARLQLPSPVQTIANHLFVKAFGINLGEAQKTSAGDYASIEDLFIRQLKPGLRPVGGRYVSPADGFLAWSARLQNGAAIQAKGILYNPAELVWGGDSREHTAEATEFSWFTTVYLAPSNYHRVHSPVSGRLLAVRHIPGDLWPVNLPFVENFHGLFQANERLVFDFELGEKDGPGDAAPMRAHVVMVGAFNVGRMTSPFAPGLVTNDDSTVMPEIQRTWSLAGSAGDKTGRGEVLVGAGEELGAFLLGSTVVVVLNKAAMDFLNPVQASGNHPILMGQTLGTGLQHSIR